MSKSIEIQDSKTVYVAWTNTALTEGRGYSVPYVVAESPETAARLGRKGSVQGSDCHVAACTAVRVDNQWLVPGRIAAETKDDAALRAKREAREAAAQKARDAGLSDDDIAALVG